MTNVLMKLCFYSEKKTDINKKVLSEILVKYGHQT